MGIIKLVLKICIVFFFVFALKSRVQSLNYNCTHFIILDPGPSWLDSSELVEHCTSIVKVMGSNSWSPLFFRLSFRNSHITAMVCQLFIRDSNICISYISLTFVNSFRLSGCPRYGERCHLR